MKSFIQYIKDKFILIAMVALGILIVISSLLTWYNKQQLVETARIKAEAEMVKYLFEGIFERTLRSIDLGIRGYALTNNKQLLNPYDGAMREYPINMRRIDSLLYLQKQDTSVQAFAKIKVEIDNYLKVGAQLIEYLNNGQQQAFLELMNQDKGFDAWRAFAPFFQNIMAFENALIEKAQADYENAMNRNLMVQLLLLIVGSVILVMIAIKLKKEENMRQEIFNRLRESSFTYLFHPGEKDQTSDHSSIINDTVNNFKKASLFISSISNADYNVEWEGLNVANETLNENTLAGQLHKMKNQLLKIRAEEQKRNWMNQGLTQYSEVVRKHQDNMDALCFESVRFIVRYVQAQQGGLFTVKKEGGETYLTLAACFAFDRKKFIEKRIEVGEGLVGQVYLEGRTARLTKVPEGYARITSGLGGARPNGLVIVPLKHNEEVVAVVELAALAPFTDDQVQLVEVCAEILAASISTTQNNDRIKNLLQETQMQAESMKTQEEEMRQNMEELSATQEEMLRKEREYISRIAALEAQQVERV